VHSYSSNISLTPGHNIKKRIIRYLRQTLYVTVTVDSSKYILKSLP